MTTAALATVPKADAKKDAQIKKVVSKKLFKKQKPEPEFKVSHPVEDFLSAIISVVMIVPAVLVGILTVISAGFETGLMKALDIYRKGTR